MSRNERLKMRFQRKIFLSLLDIVYEYECSAPKYSPRGRVMETDLVNVYRTGTSIRSDPEGRVFAPQ